MDIFKNNLLYPNESIPVMEHFQQYFDSVMISLMPFFKIQNNETYNSYSSSKLISLESAKEKNEIFSKIDSFKGNIYTANDEYPKTKEIYEKGSMVSWSSLIDIKVFENINEVNLALKTSIGAYRKEYERKDLHNRLNNFTERNRIWHPLEGQYNILSKMAIYRCLNALNISKITVVDEYLESHKNVDLKECKEIDFIELIEFKDYYIYDIEKKILFSLDWDSFFFLIATNKNYMKLVIQSNYFEGFLCSKSTTHLWEFINNI